MALVALLIATLLPGAHAQSGAELDCYVSPGAQDPDLANAKAGQIVRITCETSDADGSPALDSMVDGEYLSGPHDPDGGGAPPPDFEGAITEMEGNAAVAHYSYVGKSDGIDVLCFWINHNGKRDINEGAPGCKEGHTTDQVTVIWNATDPPAGADLVNGGITYAPFFPQSSDRLLLQTFVSNTGSLPSDPFSVTFFVDGNRVAQLPGDPLAPGESIQISARNLLLPEGRHELRSLIEPSGKGDVAFDNHEAVNEVDILRPESFPLPDLSVSSVVLTEPNVVAGNNASFTARIANSGGLSGDFHVRFLVDGRVLGEILTEPVGAGESILVGSPRWVAALGAHRIEVVADARDALRETNERNNRLTSRVSVAREDDSLLGRPDLRAIKPDTAATAITAGDRTKFLGAISNLGRDEAGPFSVRLTVDGRTVDTLSFKGLQAAETQSFESDGWRARAGKHRIGVVVDPGRAVREMVETNNTAVALLDVSRAERGRPDLKVADIVPSRQIDAGDAAPISAVVRNTGTKTSDPAIVRFTLGGTVIGEAVADALGPSASATVASDPVIASRGRHNIRVQIDPHRDVAEQNEANNVRSERWIVKRDAGGRGNPDFAISSVWVAPSNPQAGDTTSFYGEIKNLGGSTNRGVAVAFMLDGKPFSTQFISGVSPGESLAVTSEVWTANKGRHVLTVVVDPDGDVADVDKGNNSATRDFQVSPAPGGEHEMGALTADSAQRAAPIAARPAPPERERNEVTWDSTASLLPALAPAPPAPQTFLSRTTQSDPIPTDATYLLEVQRPGAPTLWYHAIAAPPGPGGRPALRYIDLDAGGGGATQPCFGTVTQPPGWDIAVGLAPGVPDSGRPGLRAVLEIQRNPTASLIGVSVRIHIQPAGAVLANPTGDRTAYFVGYRVPGGQNAPTLLLADATLRTDGIEGRLRLDNSPSGTQLLGGVYRGAPRAVQAGNLLPPTGGLCPENTRYAAHYNHPSERTAVDVTATLTSPSGASLNLSDVRVNYVAPRPAQTRVEWQAPLATQRLVLDTHVQLRTGGRPSTTLEGVINEMPTNLTLNYHTFMRAGEPVSNINYSTDRNVGSIRATLTVEGSSPSVTEVALRNLPTALNAEVQGSSRVRAVAGCALPTGPTDAFCAMPGQIEQVMIHRVDGTTTLTPAPAENLYIDTRREAGRERDIYASVPGLQWVNFSKSGDRYGVGLKTANDWPMRLRYRGDRTDVGGTITNVPRQLSLDSDFRSFLTYAGSTAISAIDVYGALPSGSLRAVVQNIPAMGLGTGGSPMNLTLRRAGDSDVALDYRAGGRIGSVDVSATSVAPVSALVLRVEGVPTTLRAETCCRGTYVHARTDSPNEYVTRVRFRKIDRPALPALTGTRAAAEWNGIFVDTNSGEIDVSIPQLRSATYSYSVPCRRVRVQGANLCVPNTANPGHGIQLATRDPWPMTFDFLSTETTAHGEIRNVPPRITFESDFASRLTYDGHGGPRIDQLSLAADLVGATGQSRFTNVNVEFRQVPNVASCSMSFGGAVDASSFYGGMNLFDRTGNFGVNCRNSDPLAFLRVWGSQGVERGNPSQHFDARAGSCTPSCTPGAVPSHVQVGFNERRKQLRYTANARLPRLEVEASSAAPFQGTDFTRADFEIEGLPGGLDARFDENTKTFKLGRIDATNQIQPLSTADAFERVHLELSNRTRSAATIPAANQSVQISDTDEKSVLAGIRGLRYLELRMFTEERSRRSVFRGRVVGRGGPLDVGLRSRDGENAALRTLVGIRASLPPTVGFQVETTPHAAQYFGVEPSGGPIASPEIWLCQKAGANDDLAARRCDTGARFVVEAGDIDSNLGVLLDKAGVRSFASGARGPARLDVAITNPRADSPVGEGGLKEITGGLAKIDIEITEPLPKLVDVGWPRDEATGAFHLWVDTLYPGTTEGITGRVLLARTLAEYNFLSDRWVTPGDWPRAARYRNATNVLLHEDRQLSSGGTFETHSDFRAAFARVHGLRHLDVCLTGGCRGLFTPRDDGFAAEFAAGAHGRERDNLVALVEKSPSNAQDYRPWLEARVERAMPRQINVTYRLPTAASEEKSIEYSASDEVTNPRRPADPVSRNDPGVGSFFVEMPEFDTRQNPHRFVGNGVLRFTAQNMPRRAKIAFHSVFNGRSNVFPNDTIVRDRPGEVGRCPATRSFTPISAEVEGFLDVSYFEFLKYDFRKDAEDRWTRIIANDLKVQPGRTPRTDAHLWLCADPPPDDGAAAAAFVGSSPWAPGTRPAPQDWGTARVHVRIYGGKQRTSEPPVYWDALPNIFRRAIKIEMCPEGSSPGFRGTIYLYPPLRAAAWDVAGRWKAWGYGVIGRSSAGYTNEGLTTVYEECHPDPEWDPLRE